MKLFTKMLLLLSVVSLLPLVGFTLYDFKVTMALGRGVAARSSAELQREAAEMLRQAVEIQARLVAAQGRAMETIVEVQATEMERLLAEDPGEPPRVFFSEDYDTGCNLPDDITESPLYGKPGPDGALVPGRVSFGQLDFKLAPGVEKGAVSKDIARLAAMAPTYKLLYGRHSDSVVYQYTALESGVHSCYPGIGGYPEDFDPRQRPWYIQAKEAGKLTWVGTRYLDSAGMGILSRVAMPVHRPDGTFAGVTAVANRTVQTLHMSSAAAPWASSLKVFMVALVANPQTQKEGLLILGENSYRRELQDWRTPLRDEWLEPGDPSLCGLMIEEMKGSKSGSLVAPFAGRDSLWAYSGFGKEGGALVLVASMDAVTAHARDLQELIFAETYGELKVVAVVAALFMCLVVLTSLVGSRAITNPLVAISRATERIAVGDLDAEVPESASGDEVGNLTRSVASMRKDLRKYIRELTEATASRERMESELRIARDIQTSILPKRFPPFPDTPELDLFAVLESAREVGGDLYDFFLVDEDHLFFAIGDVSGKGVGAALFMAMTKSLMKSAANRGLPPDAVLSAVNSELIPDNDTCMFVTLLCGILDLNTGEAVLSNAGHNPPLLLKKGNGAGFCAKARAPFVGVLEDAVFVTESVTLHAGDTLFMYTDGVTEAADENNRFYSAEGLLTDVSHLGEASPEEAIGTVLAKVRTFCGRAPQSDDITLLAIRYNGGGKRGGQDASLHLPGASNSPEDGR